MFRFHSLRVIFSTVLIAVPLVASATAIESFEELSKKLPQSDLKHSFCYAKKTDKGLEFEGRNQKGKVRIASVSKLATSLWTVDNLGPFYRFETKFVYSQKDKTLHIVGGRDPFFGRRSMNFVISELNRLGITQIELVTFDQAFTFFPSVEDRSMRFTTIGVGGGVSIESVRDNLDYILNTTNWNETNFKRYENVAKLAKELGLEMAAKPSMKVNKVDFRDRESFVPSEDAVVYEYKSTPAYQYVKQMNIYSLNYTADELFRFMGGSTKFKNYAESNYGITRDDLEMNTGSGLPDYYDDKRVDNYSNCETIVKVVSTTEDVLTAKSKLQLKDVMLVAGVDDGTLGKFYRDSDLKSAVIAKTGTVNQAITLAGIINAIQGKIFFGLFWQIQDADYSTRARNLRDEVVSSLVTDFGGPSPVKYAEYGFIPFDKKSSLRQPLVQNNLMNLNLQRFQLNYNALDEAVRTVPLDLEQAEFY